MPAHESALRTHEWPDADGELASMNVGRGLTNWQAGTRAPDS
jgi:hypothetical protein